jgi:Vitamin K epoxide reductase family
VGLMAFAPSLISPQANKAAHNQLNNLTWLGLLLAGVGMAVFSGYLMYLLAFVIKAICPFCIASAIFTLIIFGLTLFGHDWDDLGQVIFIGMAAALVSLLVSLFLYNTSIAAGEKYVNGEIQITDLAPTTAPAPGIGWEIKSTSGAAEIELAKHLTQKGAKLYSAYWCPHCYEQKQLFGKQAWAEVTNIECAADAKKNPQPEACAQAGIKGFPTWIIDGKSDPGVKKLAKLGELTGYKGKTEFKYDRLFNR